MHHRRGRPGTRIGGYRRRIGEASRGNPSYHEPWPGELYQGRLSPCPRPRHGRRRGDGRRRPDGARRARRIIDPICKGRADYTKGTRLQHRSHVGDMSNWRLIGNLLLSLLTNFLSGYWGILDSQNGYRTISREALETSRSALPRLRLPQRPAHNPERPRVAPRGGTLSGCLRRRGKRYFLRDVRSHRLNALAPDLLLRIETTLRRRGGPPDRRLLQPGDPRAGDGRGRRTFPAVAWQRSLVGAISILLLLIGGLVVFPLGIALDVQQNADLTHRIDTRPYPAGFG